LTANICRKAAAIAFRPQNVYRNGVPVRSGTTTPPSTMGDDSTAAECNSRLITVLVQHAHDIVSVIK